MNREEVLLKNISTNITKLRKKNNYTQLQLAEMLGYSDKSISKWERGEAIPDLVVLYQIADLFEVTLDDIILEDNLTKKQKLNKHKKNTITLLSFGLTWLVATLVYVLVELIYPNKFSWLSFIYAIPVSLIVLIVFFKLWNQRKLLFTAISLLYWSLALALYLTIKTPKIWLLFILVIPLQILTIIWFIYKQKKSKNK